MQVTVVEEPLVVTVPDLLAVLISVWATTKTFLSSVFVKVAEESFNPSVPPV